MNTRSLIATLAVCATALTISVVMSSAGPLTPPAGPIAPTNKTLAEVEPRIAVNAANTPGDVDSLFKIAAPGSYYLTGNITGVPGKHGIEIEAHNVTLDLRGYALIGAAGSLNGVNMPARFESVVIRNGVVSNWGGVGVNARISNGAIESVHARQNAGWGIDNTNSFSSRITGCSAISNGAGAANTGGIRTGAAATVESCQARNNTGDGIAVGFGSIVSENSASFNTGDGIFTSAGSIVSGSTAFSNNNSGIVTGSNSTVTGNTASSNNGDGIFAGSGSTVSDNSASFNTGDGIHVTRDSIVLNNACDNNGFSIGDGAGIRATAEDNRIEGNNVTDNDRGIDVDDVGNIIIRNTASGNTTHYDIIADNTLGQVFDFSGGGAISSSVVNGFGAWPGPWANFIF